MSLAKSFVYGCGKLRLSFGGITVQLSSYLSLRAIAAMVWMAPVTACALPISDEHGTTHYLVLGIGLVSVSAPAEDDATTAVSYRALGLMAATEPNARVALGYSSGTTIAIPSTANITVSFDEDPIGQFTIAQTSYVEAEYEADCLRERECDD